MKADSKPTLSSRDHTAVEFARNLIELRGGPQAMVTVTYDSPRSHLMRRSDGTLVRRRNFLFSPAAARSLLKRNIPETNKLSCAYKRATNTYGAGFQLSLCRSPPEHHLAWTASGPAKLRAFRKNMERKRRWIAIRRAAHSQQGYRTQNCRPPNPFGRC
jgi:hypothetical protein